MRDPNRIGEVLAALGELWQKYPDMRLGQLILNTIEDPRLYYIEDEDLIKHMNEFYDSMQNGVALLKKLRSCLNDE